MTTFHYITYDCSRKLVTTFHYLDCSQEQCKAVQTSLDHEKEVRGSDSHNSHVFLPCLCAGQSWRREDYCSVHDCVAISCCSSALLLRHETACSRRDLVLLYNVLAVTSAYIYLVHDARIFRVCPIPGRDIHMHILIYACRCMRGNSILLYACIHVYRCM